MAARSGRRSGSPSAPGSLLEWSFGDALEAMMESDASAEIPERDTRPRPAGAGQAKASARQTTSGRRTAPGKRAPARG